MRNYLLYGLVAAALSAPALAGDTSLEGVDSGKYQLDPTHAYTTFSVSHFGLSDYVVNLTGVSATLNFNPEDPAGSTIEVAIDPTKINTYLPDAAKKVEWENEISNDPKFFNSAAHPAIMFKSTSAKTTGAASGTVSGDLTFLGVTKPVTLDVIYNGKTNVPWQGDNDILGFTAKTVFKRSDWGMSHLQGGIGDEVTINFSGEFVYTGE